MVAAPDTMDDSPARPAPVQGQNIATAETCQKILQNADGDRDDADDGKVPLIVTQRMASSFDERLCVLVPCLQILMQFYSG